jgi:hypothetical protein
VRATEAALAALSPFRGNNHPLNHIIILRQDKQLLVDANSADISEKPKAIMASKMWMNLTVVKSENIAISFLSHR